MQVLLRLRAKMPFAIADHAKGVINNWDAIAYNLREKAFTSAQPHPSGNTVRKNV
jgi:hypothetical protein